jgi:hypothetical protein
MTTQATGDAVRRDELIDAAWNTWSVGKRDGLWPMSAVFEAGYRAALAQQSPPEFTDNPKDDGQCPYCGYDNGGEADGCLSCGATKRKAEPPPLTDAEPAAWKSGNEFAPFHPQASHVPPDYRDGWNACYKHWHARRHPPARDVPWPTDLQIKAIFDRVSVDKRIDSHLSLVLACFDLARQAMHDAATRAKGDKT